MTKSEFITQLHKDVDAFSAHIDKLNQDNPDEPVGAPDIADWFEMFEMFVEG